MQNPLKTLVDIGVSNHSSSLSQLRQRTVNVVNILYLALMLIIILIRAANGQLMVVLVNSTFFLLMLASTYMSYNGKLAVSIALSGWVVVTQPFLLSYFDLLPAFQMLPQLVLLMGIFQIASPTRNMRFAFLIYSLVLLLLVSTSQGFSVGGSLPFLIQILIIGIAVNYYVNFLESQDSTLNRAIDNLKKTNKREHALNETLSKKNADLKIYTDIMSHDLRSPLQSIMMNSELVGRNSGSVETINQCSQLITKSANSMNQLLDDVLLYSKVDSDSALEPEQIELNPLVDEIIESQLSKADRKHVNLIVGKLPTILGDRSLLRTLFQNLISNALKFRPQNEPDHIIELQISAKPDNSGNHIISVQDNGIGISMDDLDNLFVPFKRLHSADYDGTGLGLSICKRVMHTHNGDIILKSSSERGSCFLLMFRSASA